MTKIVIITSQLRFEILKEAFDNFGITGMTVTKVLGYGLQKGNTEYYRGAEVSVHLLPKVKLETSCLGYSCGCGGGSCEKSALYRQVWRR